jgi:hypothetical protein
VWKIGSYQYFRSFKTGTLDDDEEEKENAAGKENASGKTEKKDPEEPTILEELG